MIAEPPAATPDLACGFEPLTPLVPTASDVGPGTLTAAAIKDMFGKYLSQPPQPQLLVPGWTYLVHPDDVITAETDPNGKYTVKINGKAVYVEHKQVMDWPVASIGLTSAPLYPFSVLPAAPAVDPATLPDQDIFPLEVKFDVTSVDIANGMKGNSENCAIALSAKRRFDGAASRVGGSGVFVAADDGRHATYESTPEMALFVYDFDRRRPVQPTTFTLRRLS